MKKKFLSEKITNWEYWPTFMFYAPNVPYGIYLAFKARHTSFFSAVNPAIKSSGNGTESKYKTIQLVPDKYKPKSVFVKPNTNFKTVLNQLEVASISFPLIAKPDIGFRGLLVTKINNQADLQAYLQNYPIDILLQEFLDHENECGVFYHRKPNTEKGYISSLTLKNFTTIIGNGSNTLKELILQDERAKLYLDLFSKTHKNNLNNIPEKGEKIKLTDIGNHSKGTEFIYGNHLISKKLEETFDDLSKSIDGWYYGRVDIKYNNFEHLENGTDFKVLEINGIMAEPTHIYDSKNYTYFKALKAIRTHWKAQYEIATINHKKNKIPYKKTSVIIKEFIDLHKYLKVLKHL